MMRWLQKLFGAAHADNAFPVPWDAGRPSIYRFLAAFDIAAYAPLPDNAASLPDEEQLASALGNGLKWAPGAMDGVFGHHTANTESAQLLAIQDALLRAATAPTRAHMQALYALLLTDSALGFVDPLLTNLRGTKNLPVEPLHALARWLAIESPDRAAVKIAIALLGLFQPPADTARLVTLGLHEEFTLYAAVALANTLDKAQAEDTLWSLAKRVEGWGRIHIVERLANTERADIGHWLLREGYKNSVMYEYLAYSCAEGGHLLEALGAAQTDEALLIGAGEIIGALLRGGPAQDIHDYADGAKSTSLYLDRILESRHTALDILLSVDAIARFVTGDEGDSKRLNDLGWDRDTRERMASACREIVAFEHWSGIIEGRWSGADDGAFWVTAKAAEILGQDPWEKRFQRQRDNIGDQWYCLMQSGDPVRIERVVALAQTQLDLDGIATGPALSMGFGPDHRIFSALDFLLQDLGKFPGLGWPLVLAGLRSPVIRNRNLAARTLRMWTEEHWPPGAREALLRARKEEPDPTTKGYFDEALAGR